MLISAFVVCGMCGMLINMQLLAITGFSYGDACFMQRAAHADIVTSLRSHTKEMSLMLSVPEFGFHLQTTDGMARRGDSQPRGVL